MTAHLARKSYRPEIDGLRAVAVLSVVLFHLGFDFASGGFVGVDIFFVISGFLITQIISDEVHREGSFDFLRFYMRRLRRIFPALLVVIFFTYIFSSIVLSPSHLVRFGEAMAMALVSLSNVYFWTESGYFDVSSEYKPLLHTWSLSVEEQFYLFWPAVLVFFMWRTKASPLCLLPILFGASFLGCLLVYNGFGWVAALEDVFSHDERTVFFLTPFRVYEFAIGAMMVWLVRDKPAGGLLPELLFALGLAAIVLAVFGFDEATVFPVYPMLIPCLGAALIIHAVGSRYVSWLLRNRVMVWIGSISYSLYLVHWPVIILYGYGRWGEIGLAEQLGLAAVCLLLGYLLYITVEQRFRIVGAPSGLVYSRRLLLPWSLAIPGLAVLAFLPVIGQGWTWRFPDELVAKVEAAQKGAAASLGPCQYRLPRKRGARQVDERFLAKHFNDCLASSGPAVVVVGDSHGADLFHAVAAQGGRPHIVGLIRAGCRPHDARDGCQYDFALDWVAEHREKISLVLYTQKGSHFLTDKTTLPVVEDAVRETAAYLEQLKELAPTIWIGPHSEPNVNVAVYREAIDWRQLESRVNPHIADVSAVIAHESAASGIEFVDTLKQVGFDFQRDFEVGGKFTFSDTNHWNAWGEQVLGRRLMAHPLLQGRLRVPG